MVNTCGNRLADGEEVEVGIGDGVVPVDGAVIGVAAAAALMVKAFSMAVCCAASQSTSLGGRDRLSGRFGGGRQIGQVEIGKGD